MFVQNHLQSENIERQHANNIHYLPHFWGFLNLFVQACEKENMLGVHANYLCAVKPLVPTIFGTCLKVAEMRCHFRDVTSNNAHPEIQNMAPTVHLTWKIPTVLSQPVQNSLRIQSLGCNYISELIYIVYCRYCIIWVMHIVLHVLYITCCTFLFSLNSQSCSRETLCISLCIKM